MPKKPSDSHKSSVQHVFAQTYYISTFWNNIPVGKNI